MLALVEPVLDVFEEAIEMWRSKRCDRCGNPTGDLAPMIAIGRTVLDRSGFGPTASLTVHPGPPFADADVDAVAYLTSEELRTLTGLMDEAHRRMREASAPPVVTDTPVHDAAELADGVYVDD